MTALKQVVVRVVFAVGLGAAAVQGCGSGNSTPNDGGAAGSGGGGGSISNICDDDGGVGSCCDVCKKAETCCAAAMPVASDGSIPCSYSAGCGDPSTETALIQQCQAVLAFYPLNPACQ